MVVERLSKSWFNLVHSRNLVYNACWEDPRLDRVALDLSEDDRLVVITSAGCNALDYALAGCGHVHAVDMNSRQNALLDLKLAGIRGLDYETFFSVFGRGRLENWPAVYAKSLRPHLPDVSRQFWDRRGVFFHGAGRRKSFYFHGTSGIFAWLINYYIDRVAKVREPVMRMLDADAVEDQAALYRDHQLAERLWRPFLRWAIRRDVTLALLGVPRPQRRQIDRSYPGGVLQFVVDRVESVFTRLPLADNYFWRVYLTGEYTPECSPEYLKPENFERLKSGLVDRVTTHTDSVLGFLEQSDEPMTRFVLLDHMDWLSTGSTRRILAREWQSIVDSAAPDARILWRSAALSVDFIDPIEVNVDGRTERVGDLLHYHRELADDLHPRDRVHTYGSMYVADLKPSGTASQSD